MAVTGSGANRIAHVAERERSCVFARDYTNFNRIISGSGFASYSYTNVLSTPFCSSTNGAFIVSPSDNIQHWHEEFRKEFKGAGKAFSCIAEVNRLAYAAGVFRGMVLFAGVTSTPAYAFGWDDSDPPKLTVGFNGAWTVSTAIDPFYPDNLGTPGGRHWVGFSLSTTGTVTFYVNGAQLGNPVAGVVTPSTIVGPIKIVTGNDLNSTAPLMGWVRTVRWYIGELSAIEHARYAGVSP